MHMLIVSGCMQVDNPRSQEISGSVEVVKTFDKSELEKIFQDKWVESYQDNKLFKLTSLDDANLYKTIWFVDGDQNTLMFFESGQYGYLDHRFAKFQIGDYEIEDNVVTLKQLGLKLSFQVNEQDLHYSDQLVSQDNEIIYKSLFSRKDVGSMCMVDEVEVVKLKRVSWIVQEDSNLRVSPDMESSELEIGYNLDVHYAVNHEGRMENKYGFTLVTEVGNRLDHLLPGMEVEVLARTLNTSVVKGQEDYWYYVTYMSFETVFTEGWIHGSMIVEYEKDNIEEYLEMLSKSVETMIYSSKR